MEYILGLFGKRVSMACKRCEIRERGGASGKAGRFDRRGTDREYGRMVGGEGVAEDGCLPEGR